MEQSKIDTFIGFNIENFNSFDLETVRQRLTTMDDSKFASLQGIEFQKPSTIFLIAILLGWDRFWLEDVGMGILKIVTCHGCLIWWLVDIFSAKSRAQKYNLNKFMKITSTL